MSRYFIQYSYIFFLLIMIFGEKVRQALEFKNISQSKLAELLGITRQSVTSLLKQKKPHQKTINSVAQALDLSPNYFSSENESTNIKDEYTIKWGFKYPSSRKGEPVIIPTFDYIVRSELKYKGITVAQLARRLGTTSHKITDLLNQENPSYETIKKVADALDINAEQLMAYATTIEDEFINDFNENGMELIKFDDGSLVAKEKSACDRIISFIEEMGYETDKVFAENIDLYNRILEGKRNGANLSEGDISKITLIFPDLSMNWVKDGAGLMVKKWEKEEVETLRQEGYNFIISGEFQGIGSPITEVIVTPLINRWYMRTYKAQIGEKYFLKEYPRHAIILESDVIESHNYGPYRSFEVIDGEIPNRPNESIPNGSIVTARKIDQFSPNFKVVLRKCDDLVLVTNKGIFINRAVSNSLKESLTLKPTINKDGSEQYGQFNMKHILEVWHVIAITQYPK